MKQEHRNIMVMEQLKPSSTVDSTNLFGEDFLWRFFNLEAVHLFAEEFIWHFFNPDLPRVQGEYVGIKGFQHFFEKLDVLTGGTFQIEPVSITAVGDDIVVTHVRDRMKLRNNWIELEALVVWRIVNGFIIEAWDIPSVYTEKLQAVQ